MAASLAPHDSRSEPRDETHRHARATCLVSGDELAMLVVNMSPGGLMSRCDAALASGARVRVWLPIVGSRVAEVRWSLGGRIGCRFDQPIAADTYSRVLAAMR